MKQATPDRSTPPAQGNSALPPKTLMVGKSEFEFPSPDLGLLQPSNDQLQTIHQGGATRHKSRVPSCANG